MCRVQLFIFLLLLSSSIYGQAPANDECVNAIILSCDQTITVDLGGATFLDSFNGCDYPNFPDVWYTIIGDGSIYSINYLGSDNNFFSTKVYSGACNNISCEYNFDLSPNNPSYQFLTSSGVDYIINMYDVDDMPGEISFSTSCPDPVSGDSCETALPLSCNSTINGNTTLATISDINGCYFSEQRDLWYEFVGDGQMWNFEFIQSAERYIRFEIYQDNCTIDPSACLFSFRIGQGNFNNPYFNFPTLAIQQYYIKIEIDDDANGGDFFGEFEFNLHCQDIPENNTCDMATPINCSETIIGSTADASIEFVDNNCGNQNAPTLWYSFTGQDKVVEFVYNSSSEESLIRFLISNDCNILPNECPEEYNLFGPDDSFTILADNNVEYLISIQLGQNMNDFGDFSFDVNCLDLSPNNECENASPLSCGEIITGNTTNASPSNDDFCFSESANDLWYFINGDDNIHVLDLISNETDLISFIIYTGDCSNLVNDFLGGSFDGFGDQAISFFASNGIDYYIRVFNGCGNENGEFTFSHSCPEPFENDFCEDAIPLICGSEYSGSLDLATVDYEADICDNSYNIVNADVWFSLVGDDMIYQFIDILGNSHYTAISIFEATCDEDLSTCTQNFDITNDFWNSFLAEAGKSYLIRLYDQQNDPEYHFQIDCFTPAINDNCTNAIPINCGDAVDVDFTTSSNMGFDDGCDDYPEFAPDLWYTITGTDEFVTLSFDDPVSPASTTINLYSFDCESIISECPQTGGLYQNITYTFFAEMDSVYLIRMSDERNAQAIINVTCQASQANDDCANAIEINCGDMVASNTTQATSTMNFNGCITEDSNDLWYSIIGTGDIFEFHSLSSQSGLIDIYIYEEACSSTYQECNENIYLNNGESKYFQSIIGIEYFFRVTVGYNSSGSFEFELNCLEPLENNNCEDAIPINCGDMITENSLFSTNSISDLGCYNSFIESDLWYYLEGDGMIYYFDLLYTPGFSKLIYIFPDSCPIDNCGDYIFTEVYTNSSDIFYAEPGVNYWIAITSDQYDLGEFSLTLDCTEPVANDNCDQAIAVNCNETITGSTEFALPPNSYSTADVWYTFIGTGDLLEFGFNYGESSRIQINISSQGCGDNAVYQQELEITSSAELNFMTQLGVVYYFQITTGYSQDEGDFSFDINCLDPVINDACTGAIDIGCGMEITGNTDIASHNNQYNNCYEENEPDLWYTITGTNQIFEFNYNGSESGVIQFELYEGNCSDQYDTCLSDFSIYENESNSYYFQSGVTYLIRVFTEYNFGSFSFDLSCQVPETNDDCMTSQAISCGDIIIGNTSFAGSDGQYTTCVSHPTQSDLWYSFTGNDEIIEFTYLYSSSNDINLSIYSTSSCIDAISQCAESLYVSNFSTNNLFFGYANVQYLVRVTTGEYIEQNGEFSFEVNCYDPLENDLCSGATSITCGEEIAGSLALATSENIFCGADLLYYPGVWYSFVSDGSQVYNLNIEGDFDKALYIFSDVCNTTNCVESMTNSYNSGGFPFTVNLPAGTYSLFVSSLDFSRDDFTLSVSCQAPRPNDLCVNPTTLLCGSSVTDSLQFATALEDPQICSFQQSYGPGLWYSFTGTGESVQISLTSENQNPEMALFEADCGNLSCLDFFYNGNASYYINTELDKSYLLYVTDENLNDLIGEITISLDCNYIVASSPCNCNNDQSANGAQDGTFTETILINDSNPNDVWEILNIESVSGNAIPTGIDIGDMISFNANHNAHSFSFDHLDDSGYRIQIVGPEPIGNFGNDTITISNICSYPELETSRLLSSFHQPTLYQLSDYITEINGYTGTFEFYINGELGTSVESDTLAIGDHTIDIVFVGDYHHNISEDGNAPAFPGCETKMSASFSIEAKIIQEIPTLSEWALICLSLLMMIIGVVSLREKNRVNEDLTGLTLPN